MQNFLSLFEYREIFLSESSGNLHDQMHWVFVMSICSIVID